MKGRRWAALTLALALTLAAAAGAEPLTQAEDLAGQVWEELNEKASYIYTYRYPQVEAADSAAEAINSFYRYLAEDAEGFEIPMNADYYRSQGVEQNVTVDISYDVTCNNEDYYSVLIWTRQGGVSTVAGHTFSRQGGRAGSTVALPYLLGLLDSGENDTWLQDRQTGKADELVRRMVWEKLQEKEDMELREDLTEESLRYIFYPEEDFYLDATGNPVFYLQPGAADDSDFLTIIPLSVEDILDEM